MITLSVHWDSGADEWSRAFRAILTWLTFEPETIDEILKQEKEKT